MSDKKTVSWLVGIASKQKLYIFLLLLLRILANGGAVCYAIAMKKTVDGAVGHDEKAFFTGLITFALLILSVMIVNMITRRTEEAARSNLENSLKKRLFSTLLNKSYAQVSSVHSEEWMNRLTSDTVVCANGITEILPGLAGMLVRMTGALVMIFILEPKLAYILIPCGVIFIPITFILRKYLKKHHKEVQEKDGKVRVYLQEHISNMLVIHAFGKEEKTLSDANEGFNEHKRARMNKNLVANICSSGFSFAINAMYLIGIFVCGYGILYNSVTYGTLTAVIQLVGQLQAPLAGFSGFVPKYYAMLASAERLMDADEYENIKPDKFRSDKDIWELYNNCIESLEFNNVSFRYKQEDKIVLQNICLSVKKGDIIALTGQSGCGKSTLLKLLIGIYEPTSGTVNLILKNQQRISINEAKRLFAYVPQGNCLMSGKIRDVITFGEENVDKEKLKKSIELACAEFVYKLSDGLDTILNEKGQGLSEGQMQRISISRALYTGSPILILDEATSALDIETEKRLLNNLRQLTDKTVFVITHRPEALKICTRKFDFTGE